MVAMRDPEAEALMQCDSRSLVDRDLQENTFGTIVMRRYGPAQRSGQSRATPSPRRRHAGATSRAVIAPHPPAMDTRPTARTSPASERTLPNACHGAEQQGQAGPVPGDDLSHGTGQRPASEVRQPPLSSSGPQSP